MCMSDLLAELFSSRVRAVVLAHALPRPHVGFSLTDFSRLLGLPVSSVQHECYKLERIGLLYARRTGNARLYRVNPRCPVLAPLTALVRACIGPEVALHGAVDGVAGLELAFLINRVAADEQPTRHLVLVGEVPLEVLDSAVARAETALGLPAGELEVAFFRPDDWRARVAAGHPFVTSLLAGRRLDLVGSVDRPMTGSRYVSASRTGAGGHSPV